MKKLLIALTLLPLTALADNFSLSWGTTDPRATASNAECRIGSGFTNVGTGPAQGPINFTRSISIGDVMECRTWSTAPGFQDSPRSDLIGYTHTPPTLTAPTGGQLRRVP